ncbi:AlkZ family DNA glycosylase [Paenibacillus sp. PR3]|uniref:AlkZ family DNA glycosylase n=1 Tax=Paenibacillus terricola TaxID=2763503 RepID=A0ABR8MSI9_9BACL|nr:winged helix DNA-binding domain-containing protein [Paenibacillus terricola]MBD3918888.1 AlkZ family DNA glycosylase [Paenibacillus terricola]
MTKKNSSLSVLSHRELNRALLARQMLLQRENITALEAIERIIGLQAQATNPPYYALWARLENFQKEHLAELILSKQAVRIALMRSTIHLVSAQDALMLRPWVQPALDRSLNGAYGKLLIGIEPKVLAAAGRAILEQEGPMTLSDLGKRLTAQWPSYHHDALGAAIRNGVPLVQVPPRGLWGITGQAVLTPIETWLNQPVSSSPDAEALLMRYLQAYGPASVKDFQAWSGMTKLRDLFEQMRPKLEWYKNQQGDELFDLPDAPRPASDLEVLPRFLGEFDHVLLSHADRTRIMDESYRRRVITKNGIVKATILIDGFVAGLWTIEERGHTAVMHIESFTPLSLEQRLLLEKEGERLLRFAAEAVEYDIAFVTSTNA